MRRVRASAYGVRPLYVPSETSSRYSPLADRAALEQSLRTHYFSNREQFPDPDYLLGDDGRADLAAHVDGRLDRTRAEVITWITAHIPLAGKRIIEVGCGTGSSTIALVEQGASVIATDIDPGSIAVAADRLKAHGLSADLRQSDGMPDGDCDLILMFAVLEHMTL